MVTIFCTLIASVLLPLFSKSKKWHLCIGVLLPLTIICQIWWIVYSQEYTSFTVEYAISLNFTITQIYAYFIAFISFLWLFANIYTVFYITESYGAQKLKKFLPFYNAAVSSAICIALSSDLITTFIFYEILTISTLPIVGFNRDDKSRQSIIKYIIILASTAVVLFLPAIFILQNTIGTTEFIQDGTISQMFSREIDDPNLWNYSYTPSHGIMMFMLVMIIFGVAKNAIFPFNGWLPAAMCAPAPVSALLHAVAVVKSGAFIMYKVIYEYYGMQYFSHLKVLYQPIFIIITFCVVIGIIIASIKAILATDIKKILAFSTISNMTYIFLLFFVGTHAGMTAGFYHIAVHGITKIGLFFIAGLLYLVYKTNDYTRMSGAFHRDKTLTVASIIFSFALMGLPLTSGFVSKSFTVNALANSQSFIAIVGIVFSTFATTIYLGKPLLYFNAKAKKMIFSQNIRRISTFVIFPITVINFLGFGFAFLIH